MIAFVSYITFIGIGMLFSREKLLALCPHVLFLMYALALTWGVVKGGAWAGIGIGGTILSMLTLSVGARFCPRPHKAIGFWVLSFLLCASAFSPQAIEPGLAWHTTFKMASIFLPLLFLSDPRLQMAGAGLPRALPTLAFLMMGALIALDLLLIKGYTAEVFEENSVTKFNRGLSYAVLLVWPMASILARKEYGRRTVLAGLVIVLATSLVLTHSRAAQTGLALALGAFVLALWRPGLSFGALGIGTGLSFGWPMVARYVFTAHPELVARLPDSWHARVEIWDYMAHRILERPWLGWGLGTSHKLDWANPHGAQYVFMTFPAAHPHNAITQLWVELGVPGLVLGAMLAFGALVSAWRLPERLRPYALAAYAMSFGLAMVAYDFWTDSLWASMALTAFLFAVFAKAKELKLP